MRLLSFINPEDSLRRHQHKLRRRTFNIKVHLIIAYFVKLIIIFCIGSKWSMELRWIRQIKTLWILSTWMHWCVCFHISLPCIINCCEQISHDRYSRRVLWLETSITNNNPKVIAWYYLRCVGQIQGNLNCNYIVSDMHAYQSVRKKSKPLGAPKLVRCDCGTENSVIAYLQPFLTEDFASFRYGTSVSNQVSKS